MPLNKSSNQGSDEKGLFNRFLSLNCVKLNSQSTFCLVDFNKTRTGPKSAARFVMFENIYFLNAKKANKGRLRPS